VSTLSVARLRRAAGDEGLCLHIQLALPESDLASFQAGLEIIGDPVTTNQRAQRKAVKLLQRTVGDRLLRLKRRLMEDGQTPAL
jgi:hypothetical protein